MADYRPRHRFYTEEPLRRGVTVTLTEHVSEQIRKVLRLKADDRIIVFDGTGSEAVARITEVRRNRTSAEVVDDPVPGRTGGTPEIHLGVALVKTDRFEMIIQKATELGVASITPLETDRSVVSLPADRLRSRLERWHRIAIEALEQSGRSDWVNIEAPLDLSDALSRLEADRKLIAWEVASGVALGEAIDGTESSISIVIGPEGGFTEREVAMAGDAGFQCVSLGDLILRSETAAIASVAMTRMMADVCRKRGTNARDD